MHSDVVRELIVHALGFAAFFWVLKRFAFKPIGQVLEERRARIEGGLHDAERVRREADALKAEYEKRLEGMEAEARRKIQEAFIEGRRLAAEVQEKSREQAREILEKARRNVDLEIEKARISLKREVARLALDVAERAIRTRLSDADHEKLVADFIEEAGAKR